MNNGNSEVEGLISELSPELAGIIAPPPSSNGNGNGNGIDYDSMMGGFGVPAPRIPTGTNGVSKTEIRATEKEARESAKAHVSPVLRKFGRVADLVPGAERIRIRKRLDNGQIGFISDFSVRDVEASGDLEIHLHRYVRPTHKGGDYYVSIFDSKGFEHQAGIVALVDAPVSAPQDGALDLVREAMHRMESRSMNVPPPVDPFEQMMKAKRLMEQLQGDQIGSKGPDPMMLMVMAQSMTPKPGIDPALAAILERMDRRMEQMEKRVIEAPPPMPMPMPSSSSSGLAGLFEKASLPEIVSALGMAAQLFRPAPDPNAMTLKELLPLLTQKPQDDRPGWRELIQIMESRKAEEKPTATMHEQMQAMLQMKEFATAFAPPAASAPQGTSFWDALAQLFSSEGFANSLGKGISGAIGQRRERELAATNVSPVPVQPRALPAPGHSQAPAQQAAPAAPAPAPSAPPIPPEAQAKIREIETAPNAEDSIGATVNALMALYGSPHWQDFVKALLDATARGDREVALRGIGNWLSMMNRSGLLSRPAIERTMAAFMDNWLEVHTEVAKMLGVAPAMPPQAASVEPVPAEVRQAEPAAPVAAAAPPEPEEHSYDDAPGFVDLEQLERTAVPDSF